MGLRQKAKRSVEEEDLADIEAFTDPKDSEDKGASRALEGLRRDLEKARDAGDAKEQELARREKELAKLKTEYEALEREQGTLVKDHKAQLKDSEAALKVAEKESERMKGQFGKKEDLAEKESVIAARMEKLEEREAKVQVQLQELGEEMASLDQRSRELVARERTITKKQADADAREKELERREEKIGVGESKIKDLEADQEDAAKALGKARGESESLSKEVSGLERSLREREKAVADARAEITNIRNRSQGKEVDLTGRASKAEAALERSEERIKSDPEFHYVMEDIDRLRHKLDENRISLNEDARKKETQNDKLRKETRSKERLARNQEEPRIYRVTLDTVDKPNLQLIMYPGKLAEAKKNGTSPKVDPGAASDADSDTDVVGGANADDDTKTPAIDPERDEALNILADLVDLSRGPKTASANNVDKTAPEQRP